MIKGSKFAQFNMGRNVVIYFMNTSASWQTEFKLIPHRTKGSVLIEQEKVLKIETYVSLTP